MFTVFRRWAHAFLVTGLVLQTPLAKATSGQETEASSPSMEISGGSRMHCGDSYLITVRGINGPAELIFSDASGHLIRKIELELDPGSNFIRLRVGDLSAGLYFLKVSSRERKTEKAIILS